MKTIGKYQILGEIGSSTAGRTYRACNDLQKTELALKVLDSSATVTSELKDEFCRDLAACAELQHPHLARIRDVGEVDAGLYVATDLLAGSDLRTQLEERRAIPVARKLELMAQVCDGIAAAHSKGIAHGNIKPSNIFISANGNAQVLDFGTGRWLWLILAAGARPEKLFPNYFAPEQVLGQPFDARSDVFSIALVLYEWLTGKYPFQVPAGLIPREIVHTELESLRKVVPEIPEALERLVTDALKKDRDQRLKTAGEFADGLRAMIRQLEPERVTSAGPVPVVASSSPQPITAPPAIPQPAAATPAVAPVVAQAGRPNLLGKRVIVYSIAAVLAVVAFITLLSRQNMRASQSKRPTPAASIRQIEPTNQPKLLPQVKPITPPPAQPIATTMAKPPAAVASLNPTAEETVLLAQIKSAWQSGAYTRAMRLVNQILTTNPDSAEARAWKKKIKSSQDAEEELK